MCKAHYITVNYGRIPPRHVSKSSHAHLVNKVEVTFLGKCVYGSGENLGIFTSLYAKNLLLFIRSVPEMESKHFLQTF